VIAHTGEECIIYAVYTYHKPHLQRTRYVQYTTHANILAILKCVAILAIRNALELPSHTCHELSHWQDAKHANILATPTPTPTPTPNPNPNPSSPPQGLQVRPRRLLLVPSQLCRAVRIHGTRQRQVQLENLLAILQPLLRKRFLHLSLARAVYRMSE